MQDKRSVHYEFLRRVCNPTSLLPSPFRSFEPNGDSRVAPPMGDERTKTPRARVAPERRRRRRSDEKGRTDGRRVNRTPTTSLRPRETPESPKLEEEILVKVKVVHRRGRGIINRLSAFENGGGRREVGGRGACSSGMKCGVETGRLRRWRRRLRI